MMDNFFDWQKLITEHRKNHEYCGDESDESDDDEDECDENETDLEEKPAKKQKLEPSIIEGNKECETYWYDLFKELFFKMLFLDKDFADLQKCVKQTLNIDTIDNVQKLRDIIRHLQEHIEDSTNEKLKENFKYKYLGNPSTPVKQMFLELAIILTAMYQGNAYSFDDRVVISPFEDVQITKGRQELQFICPLSAFCLMIIYPDARELLFESDIRDNSLLCVAPYYESEQPFQGFKRNYCFFENMEESQYMEDFLSITDAGIQWSPFLLDAEGHYCHSARINAEIVSGNCVQVRKYLAER